SRRGSPPGGSPGRAAACAAGRRPGGEPSKQRAVQIAQVVVPQVADRLPQVLLRRGAEDLGGGALSLGVRRAEQHAPAPDPVLGAAHQETYGDELSVESNGGKVMDDRVG